MELDHLDAEATEALQQNPHIDTIEFLVASKPAVLWHWPRLLQHLESRNNLHKVSLTMWPRFLQASITSLLQALQRNRNVQDFELSGMDVPVGSIVSFLNSAGHITRFSLACFFKNDDAIDGPALLADSLGRIANLRFLSLGCSVCAEYLVAIFDTFQLNQSLQTLALHFEQFSGATWASFKSLMRRTTTIRKLKAVFLPAHSKVTFFESVKSNFSIRAVIPVGGTFTEEDQRLLSFYADRNKRLDHWIEHPSNSVPKILRPELLHVASQAHPSVLFRSLLAIRGELGTAKRTRKRKRPTYFDPCS